MGELVYIYKLRTMYPYSEFIQGDIYEKNRMDLSGKMNIALVLLAILVIIPFTPPINFIIIRI